MRVGKKRKGSKVREKIDTVCCHSGQAWWQAVKTHRSVPAGVLTYSVVLLQKVYKEKLPFWAVRWREEGRGNTVYQLLPSPISHWLRFAIQSCVIASFGNFLGSQISWSAVWHCRQFWGAEEQLRSDRLGVLQFRLQPAQEAGQRQQQCGVGGRQHLGKRQMAKGIWGGIRSLSNTHS